VNPCNHVLDCGPDPLPREGAATRRDKTSMQPFAKLLWTLVHYYTAFYRRLFLRFPSIMF